MGRMSVGMGLGSAPARTLTAEDAEFAEDFLVLDFAETEFDSTILVATSSVVAARPFASVSVAWLFFLPLFFSAPSAPSAAAAFRFLSARAIASATQSDFTLPRDAGRLLFHSADPSSPAICGIVRSVKTDVLYLSISTPA